MITMFAMTRNIQRRHVHGFKNEEKVFIVNEKDKKLVSQNVSSIFKDAIKNHVTSISNIQRK